MAALFNIPSMSLGNPFSTPVGQKIELATDGAQASEDWAMYMEICDLINESQDNARDAMKAIRKRLQQYAGKNYTVIMYTLVLLETCVKNCGRPFHVLVAAKDFIQELIKLIGPKNEPPAIVQDKVLALIQVWAETFRNQPDLNGVVQMYQELRNKGMEFPAPDPESTAPIYTPERSVPEQRNAAAATVPIAQHPSGQQPIASGSPAIISRGGGGGATTLSGEQLTKLQSELDIVTVNTTIFSEMVTQLTPGQEPPADYQMLTALAGTCKEMQGRIVELIGKITNDDITAELLRINDELNNLFLRYARYEKNRNPQGEQQATPSAILGTAMGVPPAAAGAASGESSLIDLDDSHDNGLAAKLTGLDLKGTNVSSIERVPAKIGVKPDTGNLDEFDALAKSRTVDEKSVRKEQPGDLLNQQTEFDEMAEWLKNNSEGGAGGPEDSLTSSEFDRFLAERAAAAENLPTIGKEEKK